MLTNKAPNFLRLTLLFSLFLTLFVAPAMVRANPPLADNANDWRVVGPTGGDARDLVADPSNSDRFYCGTHDGQIYASADAGQTWTMLYNFNRPQLYIDCILVDPRNSQTLYVGTNLGQAPGGFYKSKDGGRSWREAPEMRNQAVYSLEQSTKQPDLLLAGTNHGVFRSDNSGETWVALQWKTRSVRMARPAV